MNEPIKDFLGHELSIGDRCAYIKNERTGSSTVRKILHVGVITDIGKSTITFQDIVTLNGEIRVHSGNDIVKLNEPKTEFVPVEVVHGEWIPIESEGTSVAGVTIKGISEYCCSVCGRKEIYKEPYCHCGAKMGIRQVET